MKILVLASYAFSLTNFRRELLGAMAAAGHEVLACAPEDDENVARSLAAMGVAYRRVSLERANLNPFQDLRTLLALTRLIRDERPDIVLAYTQKPIIYGGIAAQLAGRTRFYAMVSGLGYVFTDDGTRRRRLLQLLVGSLYRVAIRRAAAVFVFNSDDRVEMLRRKILNPDQRVIQVPGSGVDTARFGQQPVTDGAPVFLMVARLLRDKGVAEFVAAARQVCAECPHARFQLLGPPDPNPAGIPMDEIKAWVSEGVIEYLGETRDVAPYLARATVFVLPSFYREGLPRTILEAMATGRAIITTDAPGCREPIEHGGNGYLVPVRDVSALAAAMTAFVRDPDLAVRMGHRSRVLAEQRYDVGRVNAMLLGAMELSRAPTLRSTVPMSASPAIPAEVGQCAD